VFEMDCMRELLPESPEWITDETYRNWNYTSSILGVLDTSLTDP